jgi:hypothetical protein
MTKGQAVRRNGKGIQKKGDKGPRKRARDENAK